MADWMWDYGGTEVRVERRLNDVPLGFPLHLWVSQDRGAMGFCLSFIRINNRAGAVKCKLFSFDREFLVNCRPFDGAFQKPSCMYRKSECYKTLSVNTVFWANSIHTRSVEAFCLFCNGKKLNRKPKLTYLLERRFL